MVNFSHVSVNRDFTEYSVNFCKNCGGQVYSCPDPACENEVHHDGDSGSCPYSVSKDMAFSRPLTDEEMETYVEREKRLGYGDPRKPPPDGERFKIKFMGRCRALPQNLKKDDRCDNCKIVLRAGEKAILVATETFSTTSFGFYCTACSGPLGFSQKFVEANPGLRNLEVLERFVPILDENDEDDCLVARCRAHPGIYITHRDIEWNCGCFRCSEEARQHSGEAI